MDRRFQDWEAQLPEKLRWRRTSAAPSPASFMDDGPRETLDRTSSTADRILAYQRNTLAGWYLCGLMNLHRPYLMHSPPILPPPGTAAGPRTKLMLNPSRERCIEVAVEITRVMVDFHRELAPWREPGRLNASVFCYFLFDGAVALAGALSQVPPHPQSTECLALMDKAMRALAEHAEQAEGALDGEGEMAKRAMVLLKALRKAGGWDKKEEEKGELVLLQDMLLQARREAAAVPPTPQSMGGASTPGTLDATGAEFYNNLASLSNSQYASQASMFGAQSQANQTFIPYLGNPGYGSLSSNTPPSFGTPSGPGTPGSTGGGMQQQQQSQQQQRASFAAALSGFNDVDMAFGNFGSSNAPGGAGGMTLRPAQSMVMPFDVLQGVQPDSSQDMQDLDLDWARIAGMESWYSGNSSAGESGVSG